MKRLSVDSVPSWMTTLSRMQAHPAPRSHHALGDAAAGDLADLGDVEDLEDLGIADEGLAQVGRQQARHGRLHVIHEIVDDVVVADLDAVALGRVARLRVGADVEADDDGARGLASCDVGLGDAADAVMDHARHDLVGDELLERLRRSPRPSPARRALMTSGNSLRPPSLQLGHHLLERLRGRQAATRLARLRLRDIR